MTPSARPWLRLGTRSRLACLRPMRATLRLPDRGSFFKSLLGCCVLLRMIGPRLKPGHAKPAQQLANRTLGHTDRPAGRDFRPQVSAAPAYHLVALKVRAFQHHRPKLLHLGLVQHRRASRAATRTQSGHAFRIVAEHPVAQRLPIHAVDLRRRLAWMALQDQCYRQQTPHHRAVLRPCRQLPQLRRRKVKTGDLDRPAHLPRTPCESPRYAVSRTSGDSGIPGGRVDLFGGWYNMLFILAFNVSLS